MKQKINSLKEYYKIHPKRFWFGGAIFVLVIILLITRGPKTTLTVVPVVKGDLKQTVLATGQVTSLTDLNLSFSASAVIRSIKVSVGDTVYKGEVLAALDNGSEYASLQQAKANYQKVIEGTSNEEVAVAQASLETAKSDLINTQNLQNTLVENAHRALLNADLTPTAGQDVSATPPTITGSYGGPEGNYVFELHFSGTGGYFTYNGIESGVGDISTTVPKPFGTYGLFIQFPSNITNSSVNKWTLLLPNTKSASYSTQFNAYQNALKTRDSAVASANALVNEKNAALDLKKAAARPADVMVAQAQVDQAQAVYSNTLIFAPADGTIVKVDTKIGERAEPGKEVLVLQDVKNLYVDANINEANIAKLQLNQPVTMTLDAFGPEKTFVGTVMQIDPSATTDDGVVNYKIKASIGIEVKDIVRPGMNANIMILTSDIPNVLSIPKAAIVEKDGASYVNVITNEKKKKYTLRAITTGAEGDGNMIEVKTGLTETDKIALIQK